MEAQVTAMDEYRRMTYTFCLLRAWLKPRALGKRKGHLRGQPGKIGLPDTCST